MAYNLAEEPCPVGDKLLGDLYRSHERGLAELVATIAPDVRAHLALFCWRRAHLQSMGVAIAACCGEDELVNAGGRAGAVLYSLARQAPEASRVPTQSASRRKITLASGFLGPLVQDEDVDDEALAN